MEEGGLVLSFESGLEGCLEEGLEEAGGLMGWDAVGRGPVRGATRSRGLSSREGRGGRWAMGAFESRLRRSSKLISSRVSQERGPPCEGEGRWEGKAFGKNNR